MIILPVEKQLNWSNPPIILGLIVFINSFIYLFYQFDDNANLEKAIEMYDDAGLLDIEYSLLIDYLRDDDQLDIAAKMQNAYKNQQQFYIINYLLQDLLFRNYLETNIAAKVYAKDYSRWLKTRPTIDRRIHKLSYYRFGLIPSRLQPFNLFSHQFMHGDFMHLITNMIFLVMCGFVVEAALGHMKFLVCYVLSGIGGGLLHSISDLTSYIPLIGASGAISGVMAMYLALFKLKRIDFFYWFYMFVGYFKAPALIILPIYITMELVQYFAPGEASVAFLAHVGGFITGALLIASFLIFSNDMIDNEYVEEDQSVDEEQLALSEIYEPLERFSVKGALKVIDQFLMTNNTRLDVFYLQLQLQRSLIQDTIIEKKTASLVLEFFRLNQVKNTHLMEMAALFKVYRPLLLESYSILELSQLGIAFSRLDDLGVAEDIFKHITAQEHAEQDLINSLGVYARRLAHRFNENRDPSKSKFYAQMAEQWLELSSNNLSVRDKY